MDDSNYYSILQVAPTASLDEVRAAYRRLAFLYHPDQSQDPQATRKMQALNAAYDVLGSLEKRLEYDRQRLAPPPAPAPAPAPQPTPTVVTQPFTPPAAPPSARPQPPPKPAPPPVDPMILEKRRRRRQKRLRTQLKVIAFFTVLTFVLFGVSLVTGRIGAPVIVLLIVMIAYILGVFISRIRSIRV